MRHRFLAMAFALSALFATMLLLAAPASAHATVVGSTPVDGSRLKSAPSSVEIDFDQAVTIGGAIAYLRVIDEAGRRVDTGSAAHPKGDASKITVSLRSGLGDGTYTASFRIISADSHPVAGAIRFVVGSGSFAEAIAQPSTVNHVTSVLFDVVRWIAFGGIALLGGGWLMFGVWPAGRDDRRARRLVWAGWWVSVVGAVAELLVQGPYTAGEGPASLAEGVLLDATLHTDYGLAHSLRLIALGVLGAVLGTLLRRVEAGPGRLEQVGGLLVAGVALSFAASGHAESEHPRWLVMLSDTAHVLSMAIWIGGLVVLAVALLPRREPGELRDVLPTFSRVAYICVATLAVTGTYQAILGLGSWRALAVTDYGRLVLVKAALFVGLLVFGNISRSAVQRRWVRVPVAHAMAGTITGPDELGTDELGTDEPATDEFGEAGGDSDAADLAGEPAEVRSLRRSVLLELILSTGVLVATAVLIAEPPGPAALITIDSRSQTVSAPLAGDRTVAVTLSSRRHGTLEVDVALSEGPRPQQLTATAALPAKELGPIAIPLTAQSGGYSASGVLFPGAGSWVFTLDVRTSEFDSTVTQVTVPLD
jgi:copper transport protein